MRSALLTGGTSFLGTALATELVNSQVKTHLVVRPSSNLTSLERLMDRVVIHQHYGTTEGLVTILEKSNPDMVFHLATLYMREHQTHDVMSLIRSNVEFGAQLLEAMRFGGLGRLVNTGSYFQWSGGGQALNLYAATKWAFDAIVDYYTDVHGLDTTTLVLFDVYGPGDRRPKLMSVAVEAMRTAQALPLPSDDRVLDLVYVDDVVSAFLQASWWLMEKPERVARRKFAVSGERLLLSQVLKIIEEVGRRSIERVWGAYDSPGREIGYLWEGEQLPGWRPAINLRDGIARLLTAAEK